MESRREAYENQSVEESTNHQIIMRAILVDPERAIVSLVEGDFQQLPVVYHILRCRHIEAYRLPGHDSDWFLCDEEGRIRPDRSRPFFLSHFRGPIYGRALIISIDHQGDTIEPRSSLQGIRSRIAFTAELAGWRKANNGNPGRSGEALKKVR
jgi:hypothetical protein